VDLRSNLNSVRQSQLPVVMRADSKIVGGEADGPTNRGRICLICDRKFLLYNYYGEFACQVEEMDAYIKEEQIVLIERERVFKEMKEEMGGVKQELVKSDKKIKEIREETKNQARELNARIDAKNTEIEKISEVIRDREF
jgi:hypothetical protein